MPDVESATDLNARADAVAALYDEVVLLKSDVLTLGSNVAAGGAAQTVTYHAAGTEGPTSDHPAIDGIAWSGVNTFNLTEQATHVGLIVAAVVRRTEALPYPVGPGPLPFVHRVGPAA